MLSGACESDAASLLFDQEEDSRLRWRRTTCHGNGNERRNYGRACVCADCGVHQEFVAVGESKGESTDLLQKPQGDYQIFVAHIELPFFILPQQGHVESSPSGPSWSFIGKRRDAFAVLSKASKIETTMKDVEKCNTNES